MSRLAIVSSYDEDCGNASYSHVLKKAYSEHLVVDVFPLDLLLLQNKNKIFRLAADRHIKTIAEKLKSYDYVNIQCEAGLYGESVGDALRRINILIEASPNLILTMHRLDPPTLSIGQIIDKIYGARSFGPLVSSYIEFGYQNFYWKLIRACKKRSKRANVWIAVHTPREKQIIQDIFGFTNVFDFPITFLLAEERQALLGSNDRKAFRVRHSIPSNAKVIGAFGFLGDYKAYDTIIAALGVLPPEFMLFIFGGQHPQSIKQNVELDPVLKKIFRAIEEQTNKERKDKTDRSQSDDVREKTGDQIGSPRNYMPAEVAKRIRFIGNLPDPDFIEALHCSDAVVLPYLEVGQSMSGILSLALDCNANLFCSNNKSFSEARKYYGDVFHTFDIGNHVELAQKIQFAKEDFSETRAQVYLKYNLRNNVRLNLEKFGYQPIVARSNN